jgi:hypothetical protein
MFMTEGQRDYLADLAGRKGVRLSDTKNKSVSWASSEIERLKLLPDKVFKQIDSLDSKLALKTKQIIGEVSKWTFQE